jgi:hypothetical protein
VILQNRSLLYFQQYRLLETKGLNESFVFRPKTQTLSFENMHLTVTFSVFDSLMLNVRAGDGIKLETNICCTVRLKPYGFVKLHYFVMYSVSDPDTHGSALIWLTWIRIRIENADTYPDPDPEARNLTKIKK